MPASPATEAAVRKDEDDFELDDSDSEDGWLVVLLQIAIAIACFVMMSAAFPEFVRVLSWLSK